jgi:hypothetical protein
MAPETRRHVLRERFATRGANSRWWAAAAGRPGKRSRTAISRSTRAEAPARGRVYWKTSGLQSRFGYVADPDWHTPSWLFLSEIHEALAHAKLAVEDLAPEYRVVLDTRASAERWWGRRARLVFWFDN